MFLFGLGSLLVFHNSQLLLKPSVLLRAINVLGIH